MENLSDAERAFLDEKHLQEDAEEPEIYETKKRITRGKAIRLKCLDCCCGNAAEVRRCPCTKCPLYPYRMGREEKAADDYTPENDEDENSEDAHELHGEMKYD